jgi:hypothetical protein
MPPGFIVDLCITTPLTIDMAAFSQWLEGMSVAEAARELTTSYEAEVHSKGPGDPLQPAALSLRAEEAREMWGQLVLSETAEQYRLFAMLKPCLEEPAAFAAQCRWLVLEQESSAPSRRERQSPHVVGARGSRSGRDR